MAKDSWGVAVDEGSGQVQHREVGTVANSALRDGTSSRENRTAVPASSSNSLPNARPVPAEPPLDSALDPNAPFSAARSSEGAS